jgi:hypothetical protein
MKFSISTVVQFIDEAFITFPDDFLNVKLYPKNNAIAANPAIFAWLVLANDKTDSASDMMGWVWLEKSSAEDARRLT